MALLEHAQAIFRPGKECNTTSCRTYSMKDQPWHDSNSVETLVSALVPSLVLAFVMTTSFLMLRRWNRRVYSPRTYLGSIPPDERSPASSMTWLSWVPDFWQLPDTHVLNHHSIEAYLFLRFFKVMIAMCLCGICVTWPVLLPINATGGGRETQLDALLIGNVKHNDRLYAHALISCLFLGFVLLVITRELMFYINLRLAYKTSARNGSLLSSKVVLFTSVPHDLRSESALKRTLKGVRRVWILRDSEELKKAVRDRDHTALKLESAEINLSRKANHLEIKRTSGAQAAGQAEPEYLVQGQIDKERPAHRLTPILGDKVDTIDWTRQHLEEVLPKVEELRKSYLEEESGAKPGIFVEFKSMAAAQTAYRRGLSDGLPALDLRYNGIRPNEVIWDNVGLKFSQRRLRQAITTTIIVLLIIFWTIPVSIVGALSNINNLTKQLPFLQFVKDLPKPVLGVIKGFLPQLLLSTLTSLVPTIVRFIASFGGDISSSSLEMTTQTWYFAFTVIQVFLVTSLSAGAAEAVQKIIEDPKSVAYLLARDLPKGSNFYTSYFVLYGLANASKTILNIVDFLMLTIVAWFLDRTPRSIHQRRATIRNMNYGSNYPKYSNLGVIALSYSCIAPLLLGFAALGMSLLYVAFRYNLIYAFCSKIDTGGHMYNRAMQQLIVGVYLSEICLIGLFALREAFGPLVIMTIFLIITGLYHAAINFVLGPLTQAIPAFPLGYEQQQPEQDVRDNAIDGLFLRFDRRLARFVEAEPAIEEEHEDMPLLSRPTAPPFFLRFFNANIFRVPSVDQLSEGFLDQRFSEPVSAYSEDAIQKAYHPPEVSSQCPCLWLVKDAAGVSGREIEQTGDVIEITDERASFDKKSRIVMDKDGIEHAPVFKAAVYY